jgi:hypothetical protein
MVGHGKSWFILTHHQLNQGEPHMARYERRFWNFPGVILLLALLVSGQVWAQTALPLAHSPPVQDGPVEVLIDIWDVKIFEIDDRNETFEVKAHLDAHWLDERLAFDPEENGYHLRVLEGEAVDEALEELIWWPGFELTDARESRDIMYRSISIQSDGHVKYRERFSASIYQDFDLEKFPFDRHDISFRVEPFFYSNETVTFRLVEDSGDTLDWEPTEWTAFDPDLAVFNGECSISENVCLDASECPVDETCDGFATAVVEMEIKREPAFYMTNIILPMVLIVLISSAVFSMNFRTTHLGDRLSVSFTSVLTVVAFDFVTSETLPKLWYSTALDQVLTASYFFLAINVLQNVIAARFNDERPESAIKLDSLFRWGFPLAYVLTVVVILSAAKYS